MSKNEIQVKIPEGVTINVQKEDGESKAIENNELQKELAKQFHEQFTINDNAKISSFIAFVTALFGLFGVLGYVFVNVGYVDHALRDYLDYSPKVYYMLSMVCCAALCFLGCLTTYLGYSHRTYQKVVFNIRKNCGFDNLCTFNPQGKNLCNYLPDFYAWFCALFFVCIGIVIVSVIFLALQYGCSPSFIHAISWDAICAVLIIGSWFCYFRKYSSAMNSKIDDNDSTDRQPKNKLCGLLLNWMDKLKERLTKPL